MSRIRVVVADDSPTVRQRLVAALERPGDLEVVGEAATGEEAVALCARLRPDVVTLDLVMPGMGGVAATEQIMAYTPTPIVVVSGADQRGELFDTYDALHAGALEVMEKPGATEGESWDRRLVDLVRLASRIKVITHPRAKLRPRPAAPAPAVCRRGGRSLVLVGASTGGPGAVARLLKALPASYPLPVLLVIHVGEPFSASLADWLDSQLPFPVRLARDGEPVPPPGSPLVLLAPAERHLLVEAGRLRLSDGPERHSCRPSVDVLFESAARELGAQAAGVLLTGMGRDGASGLLALRRAGAATIAQDEDTSVVFGMPREAIALGAAEAVLPLEAIAPALVALADSLSPRKNA